MKVLAHWEKLVVIGIMTFLTVVLVVGYVISERQQYRMLHPTYSEQYSAGPAINHPRGAGRSGAVYRSGTIPLGLVAGRQVCYHHSCLQCGTAA